MQITSSSLRRTPYNANADVDAVVVNGPNHVLFGPFVINCLRIKQYICLERKACIGFIETKDYQRRLIFSPVSLTLQLKVYYKKLSFNRQKVNGQ